tara:strand:+ start:703 stop:1887 length:1185 start_codon:yes stop_codon:yes gene_type:complete
MLDREYFSERINNYFHEWVELRRHFHAYPELSGQEYQTSAIIAGELRKYGWRVTEGVGRTGVLAELGNTHGPIIGLRVDMDALPIQEKTDLSFSSRHSGIMHACGHDLHICIGLGVARLLAIEKTIKTGVRLLFQPAEEIAQGAKWMLDDGATDGLDAIFGVHVYPELKTGFIGIRSGSLTAAAGEIKIDIIGEAGHGARPHQSTDAIWVASSVVKGLQEAISRRLDPLAPVVISFGKISGGKTFNVIADRVTLLGTVRYLDEAFHESLPCWIEEIVQGIVRSAGAQAEVKYRHIAPPVKNDIELTNLIENCAVSLFGQDKVITLEKPSLGAEDFAELLDKTKGTMFRLGVSSSQEFVPLHSGLFSPDEESMKVGINLLSTSILTWMNNQIIHN